MHTTQQIPATCIPLLTLVTWLLLHILHNWSVLIILRFGGRRLVGLRPSCTWGGVAPGATCNPQAWGQCGEPDALISTISGPVPGSPATPRSYPSQPPVTLGHPNGERESHSKDSSQPLMCAPGRREGKNRHTMRTSSCTLKSRGRLTTLLRCACAKPMHASPLTPPLACTFLLT